MLLTRSPLSPDPKVRFSLDLHVLSAPPAFVLSQDQTLREDSSPAEADESFHLELVLKVPPRRVETGFHLDRSQATCSRRKRTLLSFQRPGRWNGIKKAPTRARGPRMLGKAFPNRPKALQLLSFAGTFLHRPLGQPGDCSKAGARVNWIRDERSGASPPAAHAPRAPTKDGRTRRARSRPA